MKLLSVVVLLLLTVTTRASNYYLSVLTGDDARSSTQAQNPATPWKSLARLNAFFPNLRPGDSVLLNMGEVFYGYITTAASGTAASPIVIAAYGTGAKPIVSGFSVLSSWVPAGTNKWQTTNVSLGDSVTVFTLNGISQHLGRFPNADAANAGYLTYESHAGNSSITDNELGSSPDWTGGEVVIRKNRFILNRGKITSQSGNTIYYTDNSVGYESTDNYGYFIQNHPATLDQRGEWCYDNIAKRITIYLNAGEDPNSQVIKAGLVKTLVQVQNSSYININDIMFEGGNENGFDIYQSANIQLNRCIITNTGRLAIRGGSNTSLVIDSCQILNSNNNGIYLEDETNCIFSNSLFKNNGIYAGMGQNGDNSYQALIINGSNNLIANNIIDSTGYSALRFQGDNATVKNNLIQNFSFVKDDGGGIYTWTASPAEVYTGRKITGNIVLNGIGAGKGTPDSTSVGTYGIYIDETAGYVDIQSNTVANCRTGLYLHNGNHINLSNNTAYNNVTQLLFHEDHGYLIRNSSIYSNILFAKQGWQEVSELLSDQNDFDQFAVFDRNYYCRPLNDQFHIITSYLEADSFRYSIYDLPQWQSKYGFDLNSKITGTQINPYTITNLIGTNKFSNSNFNSGIDSAETWSPSTIFHAQWANGEKLDGGALKLYFDGPDNDVTNSQPAYVIMHVGSVQNYKQYVLRFSLQATKNLKNFKVYIRKEGDPYNQLVAPQYCNLSTTRTENEFLLAFPETQSDASVIFEVKREDSTFFVDNVRFFEANINRTDPDAHIRFEYNASNTSKTVDLAGTQYVDPANNPYSGAVTLAPWSSIILIKTSLDVLPVKFSQFIGKLADKQVQLNWNTTPPEQGSYFEIERSASATFTKIGTLLADGYPSPGYYQFFDPAPLQGKNYYRIKEIDKDGASTYSSIILVNNGIINGFSVWPNPAAANVFMTFPKALNGKSVLLSIESSTGAVVLRKQVTGGTAVPLEISSYSKGIYLIRIVANDEVYISTIVKQ